GCIAFLTTHLANTEFAQMWALFRDPCDENVVRSGVAQAPCEKSRGRWVLAATILASSMAFIDGTVVNVALPALQTNLKATAVDVQWVIEAYSLLLSALLLVGDLRICCEHSSTDCRPRTSGIGRGASRPGQSRHYQQLVFGERTRSRD